MTTGTSLEDVREKLEKNMSFILNIKDILHVKEQLFFLYKKLKSKYSKFVMK